MSQITEISFSVDETTLATLDRLAAAYGRSRAWVIEKLLAEEVSAQAKLLDDIDGGIAAIEAGDFCTQDQFDERLAAMLDADRRAA